MAAPTRVREHIRSNVVGYVAVFIALSGSAVALPGKATVQSNDIKPNAVKSKHVKDGQLTGDDIDESTLSIQGGGAPTGTAGGDLEGQYPDPELRADSVGTDEVGFDALTDLDIDESTLFNDSSLNADDVDESSIQSRVFDLCAPGAAIRAILDTGKVTCEPIPSGGAPSGPAGGELAGSYPNPLIAADAIDAGKVEDESLTGDEIADGSVGAADVDPADFLGSDDLLRSGRVVANTAVGTTVDTAPLVQAGPFTLRGRCLDENSPTFGTAQITLSSSETNSIVHALSGRRSAGFGGSSLITGFARSTNEQDGIRPNSDVLVAVAPSGAVLAALVSAGAKVQGQDCVFSATVLSG